VPEIATPWRADAVLADRLRVGLDRLASGGVTAGEGATLRRRSRSALRSPAVQTWSPRFVALWGPLKEAKMVNRILVGGLRRALAGAAMLAISSAPLRPSR